MKIFKDKIIDLRCGRKVCLIPPLCNEFHFPKYFVLNWIFKWILKLAGSVLSGGFTFRRLERVVCQLVDFSEKFWLFVYGEGGGARASNSTCGRRIGPVQLLGLLLCWFATEFRCWEARAISSSFFAEQVCGFCVLMVYLDGVEHSSKTFTSHCSKHWNIVLFDGVGLDVWCHRTFCWPSVSDQTAPFINNGIWPVYWCIRNTKSRAAVLLLLFSFFVCCFYLKRLDTCFFSVSSTSSSSWLSASTEFPKNRKRMERKTRNNLLFWGGKKASQSCRLRGLSWTSRSTILE